MEATKEVGDLLHKIIPPRIEDAGLEDCALPPDSIHEAFRKAAASVGSRAVSIFSDHGGCTDDPLPPVPSDDLIGITDGVDPAPGACEGKKGGGLSEVGDDVAVTETEEVGDKVVGGEEFPEKGDACVDGLQGVEVGERKKEKKKPISTEAYV